MMAGLAAAFLLVRGGEYGVDYLFGDKDGHFSSGWLAWGTTFLYWSLGLAIMLSTIIYGLTLLSSPLAPGIQRFRKMKITPYIGILLLLFLALGMNSVLFIRNPNFGTDVASYYFPVQHFMEGKGYTGIWQISLKPPGYGIPIYLLFQLTGDIELAAMLLSSFSYLGSVILAYASGMLIAGRITGFLSAFFVTFCPFILRYSFVSNNTMFYIFLSLFGFYLAVKVFLSPPHYIRNILLGGILGYSCLVREEGFVSAVGAICLLVLISCIRGIQQKQVNQLSLLKHLSYPASILLVFGVIIFFMQVYPMYVKTGSWVLNARVYKLLAKQRIMGTEYIMERRSMKSEYSHQVSRDIRDSAQQKNQKYAASMLDYRPIPLQRFFVDARLAYRWVMNIIIHAMMPLVFTLWALLLYTGYRLFTKIPIPFHWTIRANHVYIGIMGVIFLAPMSVPITFNFMHHPRYFLVHSGSLYILLAFIIVKLLASFAKPYVREGIFLVCILSLFTGFGVFQDHKFFLNNPLFPFRSSYATLPDVLNTRQFYEGIRSPGIWLGQNYPDDLDQISLMARRGPVILFYAHGKNKAPQGRRTYALSKTSSMEEIVETMKHEQIDYLIIDRDYIRFLEHLRPLWESPNMATQFGLKCVHQDPEGVFQVYALQ